MASDLFTLPKKGGVLLCFLKRNHAKSYILDESPKSCLMTLRLYEDDINGIDYKYKQLDNLVNYGRLDEEMDVVYPVHLYKSKKIFNKLLSENENSDSLENWNKIMHLSEKFYFYFIYNNSIEASKYKIFLKDFYGMMKNLPSQNIMIDSLHIDNKNDEKLKNFNFDSLDFKRDSSKNSNSKIIKDFKINTKNNIYSYFKKEFCKTKLNLNFNQVYEKFKKQNKEITYEYDYNENYKNDSSVWMFYNEMQKKKFNLKELELIKRDFDYDTFEEEREYMMKVEEVYREFYEYQ